MVFMSSCRRNGLLTLGCSLVALALVGPSFVRDRDRTDYPSFHRERRLAPNTTNTTEMLVAKECQPKKKIGFLKMHKCASTTVQNIFLRYAFFNDLNVVMPTERWNYLGNPQLFTPKLVENAPWHSLGYDIMTLHTRWNHMAVKDVLGGAATFVTILRDPIALFESMFSYYDMRKTYEVKNITDFIDKIDDKDYKHRDSRFVGKIGRNQMMFDLGFDVKDFDDEKKIMEFVDQVEKNFDFVMMTDKFEESIILLKELLCLEYSDVTYLKLNSRADSMKTVLSEDEKEKLKTFLKADVILYDRFRKIFEQKLKDFGMSRMEEKIKRLKVANERLIKECTNNSNVPIIQQMKKRPGCRVFALQEYDFLDDVKAAQKRRADKSKLSQLSLR